MAAPRAVLAGPGFVGLLVVPLGVWVFFQAWGDLSEMRAGRMDPAGLGATRTALACGGLAFVFVFLLILGVPAVMAIVELAR